jgi:hypothetical protein
MPLLERELLVSLLALYEKWKTVRYSNSYFKRMLTPSDPIYKGPAGTVKHRLGKNLSDKSGFERLRKADKLSWTVEYLLGDPKWQPLFKRWEIERANGRIRAAKSN